MTRSQCVRWTAIATLVLLVGGMAATLLSGCNTMKGVGRDITSASEGVEDAVFGGSKSSGPPSRR